MAKLKNIIRQLSQEDFKSIYDQLMQSNAEKSADLLKFMYQDQLSDSKVMKELNVNPNAYYTLRSRLNQKIEEYLLEQIENPRTDLLKKVANLNEIVFTKKRTIAITTLKKLERELLEYDLSNELMLVYKNLKKLHISTPDYYDYSQLYNRHVAYMLDVDRVESFMAEYFKKYGAYSFSYEESEKLELTLLNKEIHNVYKKYDSETSHRLYVYYSCVNVFHRLFVEAEDELTDENVEPIEDIFINMEKIFQKFKADPIYFHLRVVLEFLRLEYYNYYKLYRKAEKLFDEVNDSISSLLSSYNGHTYGARFLFTKLERHLRMSGLETLHDENAGLFHDFEADIQNVPQYVTYVGYRAISMYYAGKYDDAIRWINKLLNEVNLKRYAYVGLDIKLFLAILYAIVKDEELLNQAHSSMQRQVRILSKETCIHVVQLMKILKLSTSETKEDTESKADKVRSAVEKLRKTTIPVGFSLVRYLKFDEDFVKKLIGEK
ncbi:MAG: hypothetical protein EAZ95_07300 [Bacteroidetes bacterium]|nr:MAG: hypothetical protein EAZ95_07300 [Bacteroidota bacterium]